MTALEGTITNRYHHASQFLLAIPHLENLANTALMTVEVVGNGKYIHGADWIFSMLLVYSANVYNLISSITFHTDFADIPAILLT